MAVPLFFEVLDRLRFTLGASTSEPTASLDGVA
jgi:hypothetical protein